MSRLLAAGGDAPRSAAGGTDETPVVVFFCKKGRHRSVAMAWLAHVLLRERGFVVELHHAMRDYWAMSTCNECEACTRRSQLKVEAFDTARGLLEGM